MDPNEARRSRIRAILGKAEEIIQTRRIAIESLATLNRLVKL